MLIELRYARRHRQNRRRRRTIVVCALAIALVYWIPWAFAYQLRVIVPTANLRYYVFTRADGVLYYVYWPLIRFSSIAETTFWGSMTVIHERDRTPWTFTSGP